MLKVLGIFGLIMLVPIYAMLKVASDADICVGHWSLKKRKRIKILGYLFIKNDLKIPTLGAIGKMK